MATLRRRGNKWQVQIRRVGSQFVSRSFHSLRDAHAWSRQMEIQADRGDLLSDPKALQKLTLGDLVCRYRDTVSPRKKTAAAERIVLNAFLRHPICSKRLSELRTAHFAAYRDERLQDIKAASLKRSLVPIHHLFEVARDEWGIPLRDNPLDKLSLDVTDPRRERRLRLGEWGRLLDAARTCRNPYIEPIIRLAVATAMRRSELLAIRSDYVDLEARALVIPDSKNGKSRHIPLSSEAVDILRPLAATNGRLFPITGNGCRLAWERLRRRAGIEDLHFHDLRHEAISRFFEKHFLDRQTDEWHQRFRVCKIV
jgi:integrase